MQNKWISIFCAATFAMSSLAGAASLEDIKGQLKSQPYQTKPADNDVIFAKYCKGNPSAADIPMPNYSNALVQFAAKKLTETKMKADNRLRQNAEEQFKNNISSIQEQLNAMIAATKVASIKTDAQTVLDEVSKPNVSSISETAKTSFGKIGQTLLASVATKIDPLVAGLQADLAGLDLPKLKAAGVTLEKLLQSELQKVDYAEVLAILAPLENNISSNTRPLDTVKLLAAAKTLLAESENAQKTENLEYMVEQLNGIIESLEKFDDSLLNSINYAISDILYYVNDAQALPKTPAVESAAEVFKTEAAIVNTSYILTQMADVIAELTAEPKNFDNLNYKAPDLVYSFDGLIEGNSPVIGEGVQKDKIIEQIEAYKKAVSKFQTQNIIQNAVSMNKSFAVGTEDDTNNAVQMASSLSYTLKEVSASPKLQAAIDAFTKEISKNNSQQIIQAALEAQKQIAAAKGTMNDDTMYAIQNLNYNFETKLAVSAKTQEAIDAFVSVGSEISLWANANSFLNSSISLQESGHFYFYGGVRRMYRLGDKVPEVAAQAGANKEAHWFLTQLCGEFRDRATMIEAKLKWVENLYILEQNEALVIEPETLAKAKNVWSRMTSNAYYPYIQFTQSLWEARRESAERYLTIGKYDSVDNPVPGATVCETKYIFANYIATGKSFDSMEEFNNGYATYKNDCPKEDLTDYYDFRGDSNFKHYSPESNGMIWYATSVAAACREMELSKGGSVYTNEDCKNYFSNPFYYRYNAARAGLAAWLFRDQKHAEVFSSQGSMVAIYPHRQPELAPFSFGFDQTTTAGALFDYDSKWLGVPFAWNTSDIGFNGFTGMGTASADMQTAYERIRDAVDRHTDWYSSGFNDANGVSKDQAYSPFVASSYEMSASDSFTTCGITVSCPPDGLKRWMFVFRIKQQNWYTPARILNNEPVDFDKMWFDETSFGISGLADSEKAWDRLGTAMEGELDSILYLINVDGGGTGEEEFMGEEGD